MRCFKYCSGLIDEKPMIPFLVLLLPKTYKEKTWIFSNRNHRFTPLKKSLFSREASFIFNTSLNIISGLILTKKKKKNIEVFSLPKSWVNLTRKVSIWGLWKTDIFVVKKGFFPIDGFHRDVIRLQSQKSEVLRILIYTRLKINRK